MKFEEALAALRQGAKIRHPFWDKDEYLEGCYVSFQKFDEIGRPRQNTKEEFDEAKKNGMSIVKMKGDRQHDSMAGISNYVVKIKRELKKVLSEEDFKKYHPYIWTEIEISRIFDEEVFKYPQLNLFLVMSDDWEIKE